MPNDAFGTAEPLQGFGNAEPLNAAGAQPINNAPLRPGESLYKRYSKIDPEATKQIIAGALPPIGATVGEVGGPIGAAAGAAAGTQAERLLGQQPTAGETAKNALVYGGTSALMKGVGKLADWLGLLGPKAGAESWQAANEALGVGKNEISLPMGAKGPEEAFVNPGRAVVERAGIQPNELAKMTPFQQAQRIAPAWQSAGSEVSAIADTATKNKVTYDAGKSLYKAIDNLPSPDAQNQVLKVVSRTAKELDIADWRKATPSEGRQLLQALWHDTPKMYHDLPVRDIVYSATRGDLVDAVPQLDHALKSYAGLTRAMEATQEASAAAMSKSAPSGAAKAWQGLSYPTRRAIVAGASGALGAGTLREMGKLF
jgi:hypothetical protein